MRYHAKLPVAWGSKTDLPSTFSVVLPRRTDPTGQQAFLTKYGAACADESGANLANLWYHFRPEGCTIDAADVLRANAAVRVSTANTVAKYPEYHKVWEDGALTAVAVFGKYEIGGTAPGDAGVAAYEGFLSSMRARFSTLTETRVSPTDVVFAGTLASGGRVQVAALLVDELRSASAAFDTRYSELTAGADVILYNGHAGLGSNVRALEQKGRFVPGKYQIFFINGCDTFAYVDDTLAKKRALLNADDPSGTKYMDVVTNAMPAYFSSMPDAALALLGSLADRAAPKSWISIFRGIDTAQVVTVTGEEDNVYNASYASKPRWGRTETGAVAKNASISYETETLPAGSYSFVMSPEASAPGGDADLYVRVGAAPTATSTYKCPSYVANSNEKCVVKLTAPSKVFFRAVGDKTGVSSRYRINAYQN
ncbi:MAG: hypothetical protein IPJ34_08390 [Myxococcales bacterium]|nr:hypothetical protein [Myxococcales bacterium]